MNRSSEVDWKTHTANRHRQGCSTSLMIRERTPRAHEIPPSPISPLTMEKFDNIKCWVERGSTEPSVPCWGGGVWNYSHFRNSEHSLVKLDIQMPHSPAIPLSGIHSRATCIHILLEMSMRMLTPAWSVNSTNLETVQMNSDRRVENYIALWAYNVIISLS